MSSIRESRRRASHLGGSSGSKIVFDPEATKRPESEFLEDSLGFRKYSSNPTFENQFFEGNVKRSAPKAEVFCVSDSEELKKYNELLGKCNPTDPSIEIISQDKQFFEGKFYVYIEYCNVWYPIPTKK